MQIPKSWADVSLKQYIEISEVQEIDLDELDRNVKILSILSKCPEEKIWDLSLSEVKGYIRQIAFIYTTPQSKGIRQSIRIKGQRFRIETNLKELRGGEYIDLANLTKEKEEITGNLSQIIAIFLKPINFLGLKKKSCYKLNDKGVYVQTLQSRALTAKHIEKHLSMDIVFELSAFFLKSGDALIQVGLNYSTAKLKQTAKELIKEIRASKNIGVGI